MVNILRDFDDDTPMFYRYGNVKFLDFIVYCLNIAIGSGALKLGYAFRAGIIFSLIVGIVVAVFSFYSLQLYVLTASHYHASTFEEIFRVAFSEWASILLAIFSIIFATINLMGYYQFLQGSVITFVSFIIELFDDTSEESEEIANYQFLIGIIITIVFSVPFCSSTNYRNTIFVSYIAMGAFAILFLYVIVRFGITVSKDGFDPNHELKLFDVKEHCLDCFSCFILAYLIYPLEWPSLKNSKNSSKKGLTLLFFTLIVSCCSIYCLIGIFGYLTFFSKNTGGSILNYYPTETKTDQVLLIIGHVLSFVLVIFTMLVRINVCRFSLVKIFERKDSLSPETWSLFGIIFSLIGCVLSNLPSNITDVLGKIGDLIAAVYMFFIPAVIFIRSHGKSRPFYLIVAILELLAGIGSLVFLIYFSFIA